LYSWPIWLARSAEADTESASFPSAARYCAGQKMGQTNCQCARLPDNCAHITPDDGPQACWSGQTASFTTYQFPDQAPDAKPGDPLSAKVTLESGATYEGEWEGSSKHGEGNLTLPDGGKYEGQFHEDMKHGKGTYNYPSGSTYTGQWSMDLQNGQGEEKWPDGSVFEGHFKQGAKQGHGKFVWGNQCRYEGEFDQNDMHGQGVYHWNDGRGYSGQWHRNAMSSRGEMWWSDGRRYTGEFKEGRKHGDGMLRWGDGRYYRGQWCDGRQHGVGIACNVRGVKRESRWCQGKFVEWGAEVHDDTSLNGRVDDDPDRHPIFDRVQLGTGDDAKGASPMGGKRVVPSHPDNGLVREGEAAGGPDRTQTEAKQIEGDIMIE